jgi:hypothetical protein
MILPAVVGWVVGLAWRAEVLPLPRAGWRVPAWVVGEKEVRGRYVSNQRGEAGEQYQNLRRRLEGEAVAAAAASGNANAGVGEGSGQRQRRREGGLLDRLRAL